MNTSMMIGVRSRPDPDIPPARHYGNAHPDDISSLIIHWARALVVDEPFFPQVHYVQYHEHWASLGKTSLEAVG